MFSPKVQRLLMTIVIIMVSITMVMSMFPPIY